MMSFLRIAKKLLGNFSFRLYLLYFLMVGGSAWFIASRSFQALEVSVNQAAEEILIDTANLLAELAEQSIEGGQINVQPFEQLMPDYLDRRFNAAVYQIVKKQPNLQIYITDQSGKVLFDSTGKSVGEDFSRWQDVSRTLKGKYGARSSLLDASDSNNVTEQAKGLFIAAPITYQQQIIGALTVIKGKSPLGGYITLSTKKVTAYALLVFLVAVIAGTFITWWLWRSINKLSTYAKQLGRGQYVSQPKIIHSDFKPLADAVESMYKDLEGKEYVENYTHTMAHELKSPLTGIIATTELLQQDIPAADRQQFIDNIHDSAQRMTDLIERLLDLAAVENKNKIDHPQTINVADLMQKVLNSRHIQVAKKQLNIDYQADDKITVYGEPTLLSQSLANLFDNAIDFSPNESSVNIRITAVEQDEKTYCQITLHDSGSGIAEFAKSRLFERFFSTPRPDTQQRSSGLGLAFVKEVIQLHNGNITLENHPNGGAVATVLLPCNTE